MRGHRGTGQLCFKVREDLLEEGSLQEVPIRGRALQAEGTAGAKPRSSKAHVWPGSHDTWFMSVRDKVLVGLAGARWKRALNFECQAGLPGLCLKS